MDCAMASAASSRETILSSQIEDLKKQISERKRRQEELNDALSRFPTREVLTATQEEVQQKLDGTRQELDATVAALEPLQEPEQQAYRLCARLHRLESYCDRAEQWVDNVLRPNVEEDIAKETTTAEMEIAAFVEDLQARRDDAVEQLAALRERIRTRAAELRRGYHREPVKKEAAIIDTSISDLGHRGRSMERGVSPRAQDFDDVDDETYEISTYNDRMADELSHLQERLRRLQKLRSKYHSELLHFKQDSKKEMTSLENALRQVERGIARDQRMVQQLHATNGALVSTLQMVMAQLNVEHYGTQVGPAAIEQQTKRQAAIEGKQSSRAGSAAIQRIADKPATGRRAPQAPTLV